jgi:hypothetical protein
MVPKGLWDHEILVEDDVFWSFCEMQLSVLPAPFICLLSCIAHEASQPQYTKHANLIANFQSRQYNHLTPASASEPCGREQNEWRPATAP